jgi:hypothetical protein
MAQRPPNVFLRLHKWAARQDENFLTESLTVVLEHLLALVPAAGVRLVSRLTGGFIDLPAEDAGTIELRTQVVESLGRLDLEIHTPYHRVIVEVKVESQLGTDQLERYHELLRQRTDKATRLIILTRYSEAFHPNAVRPDLEVRWYQIAEWLEVALSEAGTVGDVAGFLGRQFLDFLEARQMSITHVDKTLSEGIRALSSLLHMLSEAATSCKVSYRSVATWSYAGVNLDKVSKKPKYWVGINFARPTILRFATQYCQIDLEAARKLGDSEVVKASWAPGGYRWRRSVDLESDPVQFFSLSKVEQMRFLECFLRDSLEKARSIEAANQPPLPEGSDGADPETDTLPAEI